MIYTPEYDRYKLFQAHTVKCVEKYGLDLTFQKFIKEMPTWQYLLFFIKLWDPLNKEYRDWDPWPRQIEMCELLDAPWEEADVVWSPKARQIGGSEVVSGWCDKQLVQDNGVEGYSVSTNEVEAVYYLQKRVLPKIQQGRPDGAVEFILDGARYSLPFEWPGLTEPYKGGNKVKLVNDSWHEALASHVNAGHGRTGNYFVIDEASTIYHAQAIYEAAKPSLDKAKGKMIVLSNSEDGCWFNAATRDIVDNKFTGPTLFFLSSESDPGHTPEWFERESKRYSSEIAFKKTHCRTIEEFLLSKAGRVYPNFDDTEGGSHVRYFEPDWSWDVLLGYDHGGADHPAVLLTALHDRKSDTLAVWDEEFFYDKDIHEICVGMRAMVDRLPVKPSRRIADYQIFQRTGHSRTIGDIIRDQTKIIFQGAVKYDEAASRELVSLRFSQNKIIFHPRCLDTRRQHRDYMWGKNGKPVTKDDDSCDVVRYLCMDLRRAPKPFKQEAATFKRYDPKKPRYSREITSKVPEFAQNGHLWQAK